MKRKIPAVLLALLLVGFAAAPVRAAQPHWGSWFWPGCSCSAPLPDQDASASPDAPQQPDAPSGTADVHSFEQQVVELVNEKRAAYGLSALTLDATLCGYARVKSQDMLDQGYFSHTSPTYGSAFDMMRSFGLSYRFAGENIAMGYDSPSAVVDAWMNSEGHRANILSANYTTIGVGYVASGGYWTQWFIG